MLAFLLCAGVLVGVLAGCGKETDNGSGGGGSASPAAENQSPAAELSGAAYTPTPTPEREPKDFSMAELYESAGRDNVYRLLTASVSEAAQGEHRDGSAPQVDIERVYSAGNYVLVGMREATTDDTVLPCEYVLFHLGRPDLMRRKIPEFREDQVCLFEDGTVLMWDMDNDSAHLYDREFEEIRVLNISRGEGMYRVAVSEDKTVWYNGTGEDRRLIAYDPEGNCIGSYPYPSGYSVYAYTGSRNGARFFRATEDATYADRVLMLADGAAEAVPIDDVSGAFGLLGCEMTDTLWFVHRLGEKETEIYFPKEAFGEYIHAWNGSRFLSMGIAGNRMAGPKGSGDTAEANNRGTDFRAYDIESRMRLGMIAAEELPLYRALRSVEMTDRGYVLFDGETGSTRELLLWDLSAENEEPIPNVQSVSEAPYAERIQKRVAEIEEEYGISIHFDEESVSECTFKPWYDMPVLTDERKILGNIESVAYYLKDYPKDFFRELCAGDREGMDLFLVEDLTNPDTGFNASGVAQTYGDRLAVVFSDSGIAHGGSTFAHEMMHLMEHRIRICGLESGFDWVSYWIGERYSTEFPYTISEEPNDDNCKGGYWFYGIETDPDKVWYARMYGAWNDLEDRATVIEMMFDNNREALEQYPHLRDKAEDIAAVIRFAFPCIAASEEPVLWERATGIVLPETRMEAWKEYDSVN